MFRKKAVKYTIPILLVATLVLGIGFIPSSSVSITGAGHLSFESRVVLAAQTSQAAKVVEQGFTPGSIETLIPNAAGGETGKSKA